MRIIPFLAVLGLAVIPAHAGEEHPDTYIEAADAVVADWTEELGPAFREQSQLAEDAFIAAWQAEHEKWLARLEAAEARFSPEPALAARYEARIGYEWAIGRLFYADYHRQLTGDHDFETGAAYDRWLDQVDLERPDYLDLEEYTLFISRLRNKAADRIFSRDLPGSVKYLTAKFRAAEQFEDGTVRCWLDGEALEDWLGDHAADGLGSEVEDFAARCPGEAAETVNALYREELAGRDGHPIETYRSVDGQELEIHIYPPEGWQAGEPLQPGVVFLHGGGWAFGSWSWCGACVFFKDRGMGVAQVEYRTRLRHGTDIRDAYEDAAAAVAWLRENGAAYGVDPDRVVVSGFSAGAHLSLALASLEEPGGAQPDAVVSFSGCTDLVRDPYTVRMAGGEQEARVLSPLFNVNPASPPTYMANAEEDGDCDFGAASAYADKARAAGVDISFTGHPDEGHFFLRNPALSQQTREEVGQFLDERGF